MLSLSHSSGSQEKNQILIEWNDTKTDYPEGKTIYQLFEEQVERSPNNIAVVCEDQELTYEQLNQKANQTEHFNEELIEKLSGHIKQVLQKITHNKKEKGLSGLEDSSSPLLIGSSSVHNLPLLTSQERQQILIEWNNTKTDYPEGKTIHQLFEEQVTKTPNNIAVVYEDQELTYEQLNQKANQLAHYLRTLGVGPDVLVAIAVDRSFEMIIGLLGILKAGGAYVPLDPDYPEERLQFMLEDTKASVLITQTSLQDKLKETLSSYKDEIVVIDQIEPMLQQQKTNNLPSLSLPHHLAYVIYTSGSTGKPKGVSISCDSVYHQLVCMQEKYKLESKDIMLTKTSFGFDAFVWESLWPVIHGSKILLAPSSHIYSDPLCLKKVIQEKNISICFITPTLLENYIDTCSITKNLRLVITGGEALSNEVRQRFISSFKNTNLYLAYGPTEAAISVTHWDCREEGYKEKTPIGRPISNTQIYILDSYQNPVPIGVSGEIYIGGAGLARGYLNRPDLTAEKFVPNSFVNADELRDELEGRELEEGKTGSHLSLRLYRTGDLARYLPDGNIEFLGRIDDQVKIRGFRIELGEIESVLCGHGDVSQAIVMAREDEPGHKQLVAYVVPPEKSLSSLDKETVLTSSNKEEFATLSGESLPSFTEDLRNYLALSLPDYMIPAFFVFIDKVPLTPNGKIDRKALPAPDLSLRQVEQEYVAPQTALQHQLCEIWAEVLRVEKIGIHDNFFKLGGHSLLATQVVSKINRATTINFSLINLFENPTVNEISQMVELNYKSSSKTSLIMITKGKSHNPPLFMIHPGGGSAYCYTVLSKHIKDIPIFGINNPNFENSSKNFETIEDMAKYYVRVIKDKQNSGPYYIAGWSFGGVVAYEIAQQLSSIGDSVKGLILIDSVNPDLEELKERSADRSDTKNEEQEIFENENIFCFLDEKIKKLIKYNLETSSKLMKSYKPTTYKQKGNVILLKTGDQFSSTTKNYEWNKVIPNLIIKKIPGTHYTLFDSSFIESTAKSIIWVKSVLL